MNLFHGTNINALPSILKYGLLSENSSYQNNITITTGENWTRQEGIRRDFVSFTDCPKTALHYSTIKPTNQSQNPPLSFGIIIGISSNDINDLDTFNVSSDLPELGIKDKLPLSKIKTLFVPNDKIAIVSQLVGELPISVVGLDSLSPEIEPVKFQKEDMKELTQSRKTSKIKEMFNNLKNLFTKLVTKNKNNEEIERND